MNQRSSRSKLGAIRGSAARRGFLAIMLSTGAGNALALAASPVIARLFNPAEFGNFSVLCAGAFVLAPLLSLRLELGVPLATATRQGFALVLAGIGCAVTLGTVLAVSSIVFGHRLADAIGQPDLGGLLWTVPVMGAAMAAFQVLNSLAVRDGRYGAIARRNIVMTLTTLVFQIAAGLLNLSLAGLVLGFLLGQVVGAITLLLGSGLLSPDARLAFRRVELVAAIRRFSRIPAMLAPAGALNALGLQAPVVLFAHYYGSNAAGWFGMTQRVLAIPLALVGLSIAQVYLSEIARAKRSLTGREQAIFWKVSRTLSAIGLLGAAALLLTGPWLFSLFFGAEWETSGRLAQAMAVALAAQLVASPLSQTLIVFERNALQFALDLGRVAVVVTAFSVAAESGASLLTAAWVLAGSLMLMYVVSWDLSRRTVRRAVAPQASHLA